MLKNKKSLFIILILLFYPNYKHVSTNILNFYSLDRSFANSSIEIQTLVESGKESKDV